MRRSVPRMRISDDGVLEIVDPSFDDLPLLTAVDPSFQVHIAPLPGFIRPRLLETRHAGARLSLSEIKSLPIDALRCRHKERSGLCSAPAEWVRAAGEATLLDLKIELANRALKACRLCARNCGIDRTRGERGTCDLGPDAILAESFTHIAEEAPINPSFLVSLAGCGLRCRFCQQHELLFPRKLKASALDAALWQRMDLAGARSLSFIGGNPDENLAAILEFLRAAPEDWNLPIVWNTHTYVPVETVDLLDGIVDVYLPDYKYGADSCGRRLSQIENYPEIAEIAIQAMSCQDVPVIVRILILPEHVECCHLPVLSRLAGMNLPNLWVSIRAQYCPDWRITTKDGALARRPNSTEVTAVRTAALKLGLRLVQSGSHVGPERLASELAVTRSGSPTAGSQIAGIKLQPIKEAQPPIREGDLGDELAAV